VITDMRARATREQEALRSAFENHYAALLRLSIALSGHPHVAEDMVQDAFVRVAPRIGELDTDEVRPYLRRVVVNLWKDRLRRLVVQMRHLGTPATSLEPASSMEAKDAMWRALSRLPPRQRASVVLRYYEDLSEQEVARVLGCSLGTVKSQTSRGLDKLRKELERET
jgi:RNA polymerase sigma-70 factor (sigma-E family)